MFDLKRVKFIGKEFYDGIRTLELAWRVENCEFCSDDVYSLVNSGELCKFACDVAGTFGSSVDEMTDAQYFELESELRLYDMLGCDEALIDIGYPQYALNNMRDCNLDVRGRLFEREQSLSDTVLSIKKLVGGLVCSNDQYYTLYTLVDKVGGYRAIELMAWMNCFITQRYDVTIDYGYIKSLDTHSKLNGVKLFIWQSNNGRVTNNVANRVWDIAAGAFYYD